MSGTCEDMSHYSKAFNSILLQRTDLIHPELNRSCIAPSLNRAPRDSMGCLNDSDFTYVHSSFKARSPRVASPIVIDGTSKRYIKHLIEQLNVD